MNCDKCGSEMMIDHVENEQMYFTCINPKCTNYRKVKTNTGETSALIEPRKKE